MAVTLYCGPGSLGREPRIYKAAILGPESPLEFEDGHALVEDEEAASLLVRRSPVEYAGAGNGGDPDYFADESVTSESEPDTCETVKGDGEVCGRERPCQYHD